MSANLRSPEPTASPAFTIERDALRRLVVTLPDGSRHSDVEPARAFPISAPRRFVSLRDRSGAEVYFVADLDQLPEQARELIEADLADREFLPVIQRIVRARTHTFPVELEIETDRGPIAIRITAEEDARKLPGGRVLIQDAQGMQYLILDPRRLDRASRRLLERFL